MGIQEQSLGKFEADYGCQICIYDRSVLGDGLQCLGLARELRVLTAAGFMRKFQPESDFSVPGSDALLDDVYAHISGCDRLLAARALSGQPIAFAAVSLRQFRGLNIYHLEGVIIDPALQGNGFGYKFLRRDILSVEADVLAFHTQAEPMRKLGNRLAKYDSALTHYLASEIGTRNYVDTGRHVIDKARYGGGCLYGDPDQFSPLAVRVEGMDFTQGDALVFVGRVIKEGA